MTATTDTSGTPAGVFAPSQYAGYEIPNAPADWYHYPLTFGALAPGATLTQTLQIDAAADFFLTALEQITMVSGTTTVPTQGTQNLPLVTILINDGGSNRNLMQNPVLLPNLTGDGRWPHRLIHPRLFKKNSSITITLTSVDATNTYSAIYLNFEGFKVYGVA